ALAARAACRVRGAGGRVSVPPYGPPRARKGGGPGRRLLALLSRPVAGEGRGAEWPSHRSRQSRRARARRGRVDRRRDRLGGGPVPGGARRAATQRRSAFDTRNRVESPGPAGGIG